MSEAIIDAAHLIQKFLRSEYIVESCQGERVMGCASCTMTRLHEDLDMLIYEIEMKDGYAAPQPKEGKTE